MQPGEEKRTQYLFSSLGLNGGGNHIETVPLPINEKEHTTHIYRRPTAPNTTNATDLCISAAFLNHRSITREVRNLPQTHTHTHAHTHTHTHKRHFQFEHLCRPPKSKNRCRRLLTAFVN